MSTQFWEASARGQMPGILLKVASKNRNNHMTDSLKITSWPDDNPPSREELWQTIVNEGLSPYAWSNGPHDVYAAHSHDYDKVIYVVSGSITFCLPELERNMTLFPGDRLDLPKGTVHDAMVGRDGVVCLEGHK